MSRYKIVPLCGFALCIYLVFIFNVGTVPFSDFKLFYVTALEILQGHPLSDYYRYFQPAGYTYLLTIVFYLFNTHSTLLPQLINALMLTMLLWVYLKHPLSTSSAGICMGYLIMVFNVNYLSMVSVLCSEIPYAFFFFMGWSVFCRGAERLRGNEPQGRGDAVLPFVASGLFLGISQFIRSVTFVYLFLFSLVMVFGLRYFNLEGMKRRWKMTLLTGLRTLGLTWLSFFLVAVLLYWSTGYGLTYMPPQKGLWNIFVGFNAESKGRWNLEDQQWMRGLGEKFRWHADEINRDLKPVVLNRAKMNWTKNLRDLPGKLFDLMDPRGMPYWAIERSKIEDRSIFYKVSAYLSCLNILVLIVSLGAWFASLLKRRSSGNELFAFCAAGAAFAYLVLHGYLFEIQSRYSNHLWMMMFWCYPLSQRVILDSLRKAFQRRGRRGKISLSLMGAGITMALISLLADSLGLGASPGFGKKQVSGAAIGMVIFIIGVLLNRGSVEVPDGEKGISTTG